MSAKQENVVKKNRPFSNMTRHGRQKRSKGISDSNEREIKRQNASEANMDEDAMFSERRTGMLNNQEPFLPQEMCKLFKWIESNTLALLEENRELMKKSRIYSV